MGDRTYVEYFLAMDFFTKHEEVLSGLLCFEDNDFNRNEPMVTLSCPDCNWGGEPEFLAFREMFPTEPIGFQWGHGDDYPAGASVFLEGDTLSVGCNNEGWVVRLQLDGTPVPQEASDALLFAALWERFVDYCKAHGEAHKAEEKTDGVD
jgi:hypothetical protein